MKSKAIFYHAGCPVCVEAEQGLAHALDPARFDAEIVNFADAPDRIGEAEAHPAKTRIGFCNRMTFAAV